MSRVHPCPINKSGGEGTTLEYPVLTMHRLPAQPSYLRLADPLMYQHARQRCEWFEDFFANATPEGTYDSHAGTVINGIDTGGKPYGQYHLKLSTTSGGECEAFDFADYLNFPFNGNLWAQFRVNFPTIPANAGERIVVGLASTLAGKLPTFGNVAYNLWFRLDGSGALYLECNDGTANAVSLQAASNTLAITAGVWYTFTIDAGAQNFIHFWATKEGDEETMAGRITLGGSTGIVFPSSVNLQPIVCVQRDSGTTRLEAYLDYGRIQTDRASG